MIQKNVRELIERVSILGHEKVEKLNKCGSRVFILLTSQSHSLPVAENVLDQTCAVRRPNDAWVTDITYVPTAEGWLYLAGVKDLYICEVVGHAMDARMTTISWGVRS
jgi:transposase InsO family protein